MFLLKFNNTIFIEFTRNIQSEQGNKGAINMLNCFFMFKCI